jgi:hypothetical protein
MKITQPWKNKKFELYDRYVEAKAKKVTTKPVFFGLTEGIPFENKKSIDKKAAATVVHRKHPEEYQVVIKDSYYYRNQNNVPKIKKILSHEVAHIKYNNHGPKWEHLAKQLGAGEYAVPKGTLSKKKRK